MEKSMLDKDNATNEIIIDNESDIVQPYSSENILQQNGLLNDPQHFVFPDSTNQSLRQKCVQCQQNMSKDLYFRQVLPQISTRSLEQNKLKCSSSNDKSILPINNNETQEIQLMNMWSAGFTIVNIYVGLGLLSYPYALYQGGFISLIILAIICGFMSWTGKLLVRCFIRMRPPKKTYIDVGYKSFGKYGSYLIAFAVIFEYFGAVCVNLIFAWNNCKYFIDSINLIGNIEIFVIATICSILILPTCW
eukprot:297350_1